MSGGDEALERAVSQADRQPPGPPPLTPFGLVLLHDGRWAHQGEPILNRKLREKFDRSVVYLPQEDRYVVQIGRFRGEIELQEAGFFVRSVDLEGGSIRLSDGSSEPLDAESLGVSPIDGAWLCRVKRACHPAGLLARFTHAAQAELLGAVEEAHGGGGFVVRLAGRVHRLPAL